MKVLYIDCPAGICGDLLLSAFIDLGIEQAAVNRAISKLGLKEKPRIRAAKKTVKGLTGTIATVLFDRSRADHHRSYSEIISIIKRSSLSQAVKAKACEMFTIIGKAESKIHNVPLDRIHFHEIGATDSIADIVGIAACFDMLKPSKIFFSSLPLGSGTIDSQHGSLPLPAPAAALILEGIPVHGVDIRKELVTPTGAAIVKAYSTAPSQFPPMIMRRSGIGLAKTDFRVLPGLLRVFEGEEDKRFDSDTVSVIEANIDDFSGEGYGYLQERLFENGALDVTITPTIMKKGRPGHIISVICRYDRFETLVKTILEESPATGLRYHQAARRKLAREILKVKTRYGLVRVKKIGSGKEARYHPEYEDLRKIALEHKIPLQRLSVELNALLLKQK